MNYWLNIHHPPEKGEGTHHVCLQEKNGKCYKRQFTKGDHAFIYETASPRLVVFEDWEGRRNIRLRRGRKGIIALVEVNGKFIHEHYLWDSKPFIGYFKTKTLKTKRKVAHINKLKDAWRAAGLSNFNPRINGGLRKLKSREYSTLYKLLNK